MILPLTHQSELWFAFLFPCAVNPEPNVSYVCVFSHWSHWKEVFRTRSHEKDRTLSPFRCRQEAQSYRMWKSSLSKVKTSCCYEHCGVLWDTECGIFSLAETYLELRGIFGNATLCSGSQTSSVLYCCRSLLTWKSTTRPLPNGDRTWGVLSGQRSLRYTTLKVHHQFLLECSVHVSELLKGTHEISWKAADSSPRFLSLQLFSFLSLKRCWFKAWWLFLGSPARFVFGWEALRALAHPSDFPSVWEREIG